jgi:hypothetical protein
LALAALAAAAMLLLACCMTIRKAGAGYRGHRITSTLPYTRYTCDYSYFGTLMRVLRFLPPAVPLLPPLTGTARKYLNDLREAAGDDEDGGLDTAAGDEEVAEKLRLDALEVSWVVLGSSSSSSNSRVCGCYECFCW